MATRLKLKLGAAAAKVQANAGLGYVGPTPPAGVYQGKLRRMELKPTKSGDKQMLVVVVDFEAKKGSKAARYNGYSIFHRLVLPESLEEEWADLKLGQINRVLDALPGGEANRVAFWDAGPMVDDKGQKIVRIGKVALVGKGFKGIPVIVAAKTESYKHKSKGADGKVKVEDRTNLRINDIFPADSADAPPTSDSLVDDDEAIDDVLDDDTEADEVDEVDEVDEDQVDDDDIEPEDEPDEDESDEDQVEDDVDDDDEDTYVEDDDDDGEPEDEPEPEPEPEKKPRKRRSAF